MKNASSMQLSSSIRSTPFKQALVIVSIVAIVAGVIVLTRAALCEGQPAAGIRSVHSKATTIYAAPDKKDRSAEHWIVIPNRERAETGDIIRVRNGVDQWFLNKRNNRYIVSHHPSDPPIEVERWSKPDTTVDSWRHVRPKLTEKKVTKQLDGVERDAVEVVLPDVKRGSQRVDLFPDKTSGRITTKMTYQLDRHGNVLWTERRDYEYNKEIDEELFTFTPPAGAVLVQDRADLELGLDVHLE